MWMFSMFFNKKTKKTFLEKIFFYRKDIFYSFLVYDPLETGKLIAKCKKHKPIDDIIYQKEVIDIFTEFTIREDDIRKKFNEFIVIFTKEILK